MYDLGARVRPLFILLAVLGAAVVLMQLRAGTPARISGWRDLGGQGVASAGLGQPAAGGLSGFAQPSQQGRGLPADRRPQGNPLQASNAVMTQGYGVGSHAPAEAWGAIDLAIDGNGDGAADPEGSLDHPIYATHDGVVEVTPNSYPAGNHIWVVNDEFRTGYSHLARFAVESGQEVRRGDLIGYLGSTGMSSGPHLDYQVWVKQGGDWVNVNPLDYGALE